MDTNLALKTCECGAIATERDTFRAGSFQALYEQRYYCGGCAPVIGTFSLTDFVSRGTCEAGFADMFGQGLAVTIERSALRLRFRAARAAS